MSTVKLSKATLGILQNFASINSNLLIEAGNVLKTVAVAKNIFAAATVDETFPSEFAIYNLNELLASLTLFADPEIEFGEKMAIIREAGDKAGSKLKFVAASKDILTFPDKDPKVPAAEVEFNLSEESLNKLLKAAGIIGAPDLQIVGSELGIELKVGDKKNPVANNMTIPVSDTPQTLSYTFNLRVENLKLIPAAYNVKISSKGFTIFSSGKRQTFIANERDSILPA